VAYSPREAADRLGVGLSTISKAIRNGALPSVKLGRRRLVDAQAVDELFAEARLVASTSTGSAEVP